VGILDQGDDSFAATIISKGKKGKAKNENKFIMAFPSGYHADSDADDEYERSVMTSPILQTDDDASPTDSDAPSTEHTPTTFDYPDNDKSSSPRTIISEWTSDECAKFLSQLGLSQYCNTFIGRLKGISKDRFG
jgi:hypothetical protein